MAGFRLPLYLDWIRHAVESTLTRRSWKCGFAIRAVSPCISSPRGAGAVRHSVQRGVAGSARSMGSRRATSTESRRRISALRPEEGGRRSARSFIARTSTARTSAAATGAGQGPSDPIAVEEG